MSINDPLFTGKKICLAPIYPEQDADTESLWTHDPYYLRMLNTNLVYPLSPLQVKKKYEAIEKQATEGGGSYYFSIRAIDDDRLVGFTRLYWVDWSNSNSYLELGIGDRNDRGRGFGSDAIDLMLRYAFHELNLYRLSATIPEYNTVALHLFGKSGFIEEVRRRKSIMRDGKTWDLLYLGLLHGDWSGKQ